MPTRKLYAVDRSTGERDLFLTLHADGSLTAHTKDMAHAVSVLRDRRGYSNESIMDFMRRKSTLTVRYDEEVVDE